MSEMRFKLIWRNPVRISQLYSGKSATRLNYDLRRLTTSEMTLNYASYYNTAPTIFLS